MGTAVTPYFEVVKPTLACGFNHRSLRWVDRLEPAIPAIPAPVREVA